MAPTQSCTQQAAGTDEPEDGWLPLPAAVAVVLRYLLRRLGLALQPPSGIRHSHAGIRNTASEKHGTLQGEA